MPSLNPSRQTSPLKIGYLPYLVCFLAAMFYLYDFIVQISPSVMIDEMMRDLHVGAVGIGFISAFFFYGYTPFQLPAGLLFDRYGPRILITLMIIVCALGALIFGLTSSIAMACAGRFLMGVGAAFSFIGALLLVSRWFPAHYFVVITGLIQLMSSIGAIVGGVPLAKITGFLGWRHTMVWVSTAGFVLALLFWMMVRDGPKGFIDSPRTQRLGRDEWRRLKLVLSNPQTWWIGLYSFSSWAPIVAFAGLWGVPFLMQLYQVNTAKASTLCALIWLGIGVGCPLVGWWSEYIGRRVLPLAFCNLLGMIVLVLLIYCPDLPWSGVLILCFLFGLASSGQSVSFALVKDNNKSEVVGTAIGFNNMAVVIGGALFQPLIGILLSLQWHAEKINNVPFYSVAEYQVAMCVLPLIYFLGFVLCQTVLKETRCRSQFLESPNS